MNFLTRNADTEFHFMVDIETLAVSSDAAITEIGAVGFNKHGAHCFFRVECIDTTGARSEETMQWRTDNKLPWAKEEMAEVRFVDYALADFFQWITDTAEGRTPILWCKGTDFDAVILKNTAVRVSVDHLIPWKYNNINDVRTLLRLFPQFKVPRDQVTHNGLEDAILQWTYLEKIANAYEWYSQLAEQSKGTL